jgi:hypothetical protein
MMKTPVSGALLLAGFMVVDDPLPHYSLGIEWLAVLIEDYLGYGPANLSPVLGMASLFGAFVSVQVLVGEARQAQIAAATQRRATHLLVAVSAGESSQFG